MASSLAKEPPGIVRGVFREIIEGDKFIGIQLDVQIVIRIVLRKIDPRRFGVTIIRRMPDVLADPKVREILGIPEFTHAELKEKTHAPLEADITLYENNKVVAMFSIKSSPTGNIDYIVNSWRKERSMLDLLAILPLEGEKNSKVSYYTAIVLVPKYLKKEKPSIIKEYILRVIDIKREKEKLDKLFLTDFIEIANILRDSAIYRALEKIAEGQERIIKTQEMIIGSQEKIAEGQERIIKTQEALIEINKKILEVLGEIRGILKKTEK